MNDKEGQNQEKQKRLRINYLVVVKNLPFILFLSLLALIYIGNGHYADKNMREINTTSHQLKELRWKYLSIKSDLMFRSKLSEVSKALEPVGLQPLDSPPRIIPLIREFKGKNEGIKIP
ncbi:MAG: FtsL-like putative cell division protein [Chitinophagaceae bacterium]